MAYRLAVKVGEQMWLYSHVGRCDRILLPSRVEQIDFRDDWVGEGYETAGTGVLSAIRTTFDGRVNSRSHLQG